MSAARGTARAANRMRHRTPSGGTSAAAGPVRGARHLRGAGACGSEPELPQPSRSDCAVGASDLHKLFARLPVAGHAPVASWVPCGQRAQAQRCTLPSAGPPARPARQPSRAVRAAGRADCRNLPLALCCYVFTRRTSLHGAENLAAVRLSAYNDLSKHLQLIFGVGWLSSYTSAASMSSSGSGRSAKSSKETSLVPPCPARSRSSSSASRTTRYASPGE